MRLSSISSIASSSTLPRATAPIRRSLLSTGSIPQFFNPSHNHQPFFRPSYRRFSAAPAIPLRLPTASAVPHPLSTSVTPEITIPKSLPKWLYGCSALVFGILVVGGLTRLTESGLSITEWEPITGILPPITQEQWDVEWEKYKVSPEGVL
jgi:cytochrome c oxidase assembly protein subunit 15